MIDIEKQRDGDKNREDGGGGGGVRRQTVRDRY